MKIGLLLPSLLMSERFSDRIFAPKELFLSLADGLVEKGHEVYVYSTSNTKTKAHLVSGEQLFEQKTVPSIRVRTEQEDYTLFKLNYTEYELDLTTKAYMHAQANGIDIMHSYHDSVAHYIAPLSPIPTVYTLHDPAFDPNTLEGWRFDRFAKDSYIAISKKQREIFATRVNVKDVVHHGIDTGIWRYGGFPQDYVAFIGRFIPEKGAEDAFAVSEALEVPLHLATSDNYLATPYYVKHIKPKLNNPLFRQTGFLTQEGRSTFFQNAKALLFPIKWDEPFGMVMIEAMACGTPVIAYNRGSVPEIIVDGKTGFIVDEKKGVEGLVEAMKKINQIDRAACRKDVEENFSVEKMVEGYENVYGRLGKSGK